MSVHSLDKTFWLVITISKIIFENYETLPLIHWWWQTLCKHGVSRNDKFHHKNVLTLSKIANAKVNNDSGITIRLPFSPPFMILPAAETQSKNSQQLATTIITIDYHETSIPINWHPLYKYYIFIWNNIMNN